MSARDDYPNLTRRADQEFTTSYREAADALDEIDRLRDELAELNSLIESYDNECRRR